MKKAVYLSLTLAVFALQTGCNRDNPNVTSPGLVTYKSVSAQSSSRTSNTTPTLTASAVERNTVSAQSANGKASVVVDTTAEKDSSFSNEDVSEEYSKSGRVAFRRGQDWE